MACSPGSKSPDVKQTTAFNNLESTWLEALKKHFPQIALGAGEPLTALPDLTIEAATLQAEDAKEFLARLQQFDKLVLPHEAQMSYTMMEMQMRQMMAAPRYFHLSFEVTPYKFGWGTTRMIAPYLNGVRIASLDNMEEYLGRLRDVAILLQQIEQKSIAQTEQGIRIPKPALPGVRATIGSLTQTIDALTAFDASKLLSFSETEVQGFVDRVDAALHQEVKPAIARLLLHYNEVYAVQASDRVGLSQYPGGAEYYRFLIEQQTTLKLSPDSIHKAGLRYQALLHEEMQVIRESLGVEGSAQDFHRQLKTGAQFYAETPEDIVSLFDMYIKRIEPVIDDYFSLKPEAPYGVMRLDPANEAGMTFGYYQIPSSAEPRGLYRFNGSHLDERPMIWAGPLIYHELIPGHHFHLALQNEHPTLSKYRKHGMSLTAFTEGWGNYASSLALEMGLLPEPLERYGWLLFDSFITARLVLDTGMNHFGWTLAEARQYMLENTFQSEREVETELLRYSTDLPGQALAYKLGFEHIKNLRESMAQRYGDQFDIKDFHSATVGSGALPMPVLSEHVAWYLAEIYN